ncbi:hypothetical protein DFH09DRAFT_940328 [Mycena vulgaris]|nr:hypothetical protein DFH09DRAFT_940328 [Mycena vulgaris]
MELPWKPLIGRGGQVAIGSHCESLGSTDAKAAFGVRFAPNDPRNVSSLVPKEIEPLRSSAEVIAALFAVRAAPSNAPLQIMSKGIAAVSAMNTHLSKWEDNGWIGVPNPAPLAALAASLRSRQCPTTLVAPGGTAPHPLCKDAIAAARQAITLEENMAVSLVLPAGTSLRGAKLSKLTQAIAYQGIRALKKAPARQLTARNVVLIQEFLLNHSGLAPTPEKIWGAIRHKDITSTIKSWLWKSIHGAHRIGKYWTHIPGFKDRATCSHCGGIESLQHILFECACPGQAIVWSLAGELWKKKYDVPLPPPSMGMVLGSPLTSFEGETRTKPSGVNRLYRILISESVYLIWKLRNESVIQKEGAAPPVSEVHNRWVSLINERLQMDRFMATSRSDQNKILVPPPVVLQTWSRTLLDEITLPKDWLRDPRLLVGIRTKSSHAASPSSSRRGRHS